jgi:hypothetical protein
MTRYDEIAGSVENRFNEATAYAGEAWDVTQAYLTLLSSIRPPTFECTDLNVSWDDIILDLTSPAIPDRPSIELESPDIPEVPDIPSVEIDEITIPDLDVIAPEYNEPDLPDDEIPDIPTDVPEIVDVEIPTAPTYTVPDVPDLGGDIDIPEPPEVTIPIFDAESPEFDIEAPGNTFVYTEGVYQSELFDAAKAWLLNQIGSGSTGLDADVEQAIIDRARSRMALEHQDKYTKAEDYFAGRHHTLPPGALQGAILDIQAQIAQEVNDLNNDVLVMQGKLAQENTHFVIEKSINFENMALDHFNKVAQRAFDVARAVHQAAMEVYNALVTKYNAELEGYKTKALVYELRIRAGNLILDRYKTILDGKKLQSELKNLLLQRYNLQLDGLKTIVSLYATEMQAAKIQSDISISRLEVFKTRISAYNAIIGGITAKYNLYQAQLAGEQTKADIYKSQVQAYSERVKAINVGAQVDIANANVQLANSQLTISGYQAKLDGIKAKLSADVSVVQSELQEYTAGLQGYTAEVNALVTEANAQIESYKAKAQHEANLVELSLKQSEVAISHADQVYGLQIEQYKAGADIGSQIAASALSAVSAAASYGYDEGVSTHYSYDRTKSDPEFSFITYL